MWKSSRRQFAAQSAMLTAATTPQAALAQAGRTILAGSYSPEKLAGILTPRRQWKPYPTLSDRAAWQALPEPIRKALLAAGESYLGKEWPALPATLFLEYKRIGNRSHFEHYWSLRRTMLRSLVMAECVEGKGRFLDSIANGIWTTCEETFWGYPAHLGAQKAGSGLPDAAEPIVDLFAAETSALLAWTHYLLGSALDKVSPLLAPRIELEVNRRVLTPNFERVDFGWMGLAPGGRASLNNWTPWINSNWLTSALLLEKDGKRRTAAVYKSMTSLDRFLSGYYPDGGCDEGPGYWDRAGGSLFDCLELLHMASGGKLDFFGDPLVREIGRYVYRAHINENWFTNFADASAQVSINGDMVFRYGRRIGDARMQALGAYAAASSDDASALGGSLGRELPALFNLAAIHAAPKAQPLLRDVWMPGIQVMAARMTEGSAKGLYLAAQGGHNAESHNHNDVGNFMVYADGKPAIIDIGVETYSAKTFSSKRYEIWTMQSAYHNLPTIGGVMQAAGREYAASDVTYRADDSAAELSLNIAKAYPPQAGLESWKRTLKFDRANRRIEVLDEYAVKQASGPLTLTLMTPCRVTQSGPGELTLAGAVKVLYESRALTPKIEEVEVSDGRLQRVWGARLYRILLTTEKPALRGTFRVRIVQV